MNDTGDVKVCQMCLVMHVKLYNMLTYSLETYLEAIIGHNPLGAFELPPYVCYECTSLARKYYLFKERCLRGQRALYDILHQNGKITVDHIKQIDRDSFELTSNLNVNVVIAEEFFGSNCVELELEIKKEIEKDDDNDEYFKQDYDSIQPMSVSSDDEPLSLHKTKERNVKKKVEKKKGKREKDFEKTEEPHEQLQDIELDKDVSPLSAEILDNVKVKAKRGRPRKTDSVKIKPKEEKCRRTKNTGGVGVEEIDLEEYVTIIKLSMEEQIAEINNRKNSSNYQNTPFQCNLCYKGFIDKDAWQNHVGKHDPKAGGIECPICKFRFKTKRTLQKHYINHEKKYACKTCSHISKTATKAKEHHRWHKGVTYKCQYCDEVSTKSTSHLSHMRIKHPSEFICGVCGYSFVSKLGLTMHKTMMHKDVVKNLESKKDEKEEGPYCTECDVQFISTEAWKRHTVTSAKHTQTKDFNTGCRVCGETFPNGEELRMHHRKEHARKRPKNYGKKPSTHTWPASCEHENLESKKDEKEGGLYCTECDVKFKSVKAWKRHMVTSTKHTQTKKNTECRVCGETFPNGEELRMHHRKEHARKRPKNYGKKPSTHTWPASCEHCSVEISNARDYWTHFRREHPDKNYPIQKNYVCDICGKSFRGNAFLVYHKRTHSTERAYKCAQCPKAFFNRTNLQMHEKTHSDHRPYPCSVCFKAFKCKGALDRHFRSHTGVKPYVCEVCGKAFGQSNSRKLHVRTVHLKQPTPYVSRTRLERRNKVPPPKDS